MFVLYVIYRILNLLVCSAYDFLSYQLLSFLWISSPPLELLLRSILFHKSQLSLHLRLHGILVLSLNLLALPQHISEL